jgi:hypothetical protein
VLQHRAPALISNPVRRDGDPMRGPPQSKPDPIRVTLDHGEVVELDGGTLVLDGEESPSLVLRLAPWRALSVARVLQGWSSVSRSFTTRPGRIWMSWVCHGHWSGRRSAPSRQRGAACSFHSRLSRYPKPATSGCCGNPRHRQPR